MPLVITIRKLRKTKFITHTFWRVHLGPQSEVGESNDVGRLGSGGDGCLGRWGSRSGLLILFGWGWGPEVSQVPLLIGNRKHEWLRARRKKQVIKRSVMKSTSYQISLKQRKGVGPTGVGGRG